MNADLWAGGFGQAYTARNRVDWQKRVPFWNAIMTATGAETVLEVGCNAGWNLRAIREAAPAVTVAGIDVNPVAIAEAQADGLNAALLPATSLSLSGEFDLALTAGVLIHIPPQDLGDVMDRIIQASRRYVLAVEYAADTETEVLYRGHSAALWKRPFGAMYEAKGLKMIDQGFVSKADGFDDCTYWLLEKP